MHTGSAILDDVYMPPRHAPDEDPDRPRRLRKIICVALHIGGIFSEEEVGALAGGVSRRTLYNWREEVKGYQDPEAVALRGQFARH